MKKIDSFLIFCRISVSIFILLLPISAMAIGIAGKAAGAVAQAERFQSWLKSHEKDFASCEPKKIKDEFELCDGTKISAKELQKLFQYSAAELYTAMEKKGLKIKVRCQAAREGSLQNFQAWCQDDAPSQYFKEVTSLHGQYLPEENIIALASDANLGSLVHEYLHSLQFKNSNKKFGRQYKRERIEIQKALVKDLDRLISEARTAEEKGDKTAAQKVLLPAVNVADALRAFGYWQKLIDERNLFRLYILFGKELGIAAADMELAQKNMGFLCRDEKLGAILPKNNCQN